MNCLEIQHHLRKLFDEGALVNLHEDIQLHVDHCEACSEVYHQLRVLEDTMRTSLPKVPAEVKQSIAFDKSSSIAPGRLVEALALAVAIIILVWIGGKKFITRESRISSNATFAVEKVEPRQPNGQLLIFQKELPNHKYHFVWIF